MTTNVFSDIMNHAFPSDMHHRRKGSDAGIDRATSSPLWRCIIYPEVIRCRIYTGLSIGMSIERHLASIIWRIEAIFQQWIPGNDSFQITGGKRNRTRSLGRDRCGAAQFPSVLLSSSLPTPHSSSKWKVRRHYMGRSLQQDIKNLWRI